MVVRVCIDAQHSPFVTSLAFPQGIAPGENIELYIGTWDLPESPPPKANTIVVDPLTKVVHVARKLDTVGKRKAAGADPSGPEGARKKLLLSQKGLRPGMNSLAGHAGKPGTGNSTNSVGMGRNKCGECGQVFDSIKEISLHMQRHLAEKVPHEKNSVVTLTHRPKDGSLPSKATITQDPNCRNRVEVSIPLAAAETFLQTVLDQAQQILLKHTRPTAGGTLEVRKTDRYKEGDTNRSIILEALEQADNTEPPVAQEPEPPQRTQPGALSSFHEHNNSPSASSYLSVAAASTAAAAPVTMQAATAAEGTRSQEIDDVERAFEAIHGAGAGEDLPHDNLVEKGLPQAELRDDQRAGPSFDSQAAAKILLESPGHVAAGPSLCTVQVAAVPASVDPPALRSEQAVPEDNGDKIQHPVQQQQHQPVVPAVEEVNQLIPAAEPDQNDDHRIAAENQIENPYEPQPVIEHNNAQLEDASVLEHQIPNYPPVAVVPPVVEHQLPVVEPQVEAVQQVQEAVPVAAIQAGMANAQPPPGHHEVEPAQLEQAQEEPLHREVEAEALAPVVAAAAQLLPNVVEPPRPSLQVVGPLVRPDMLLLSRHNNAAVDDGMQDEIGSSSEAVAATPHSRTLMDPREPTSSADVDSTVGEADGGQGSPDDGGVDSTSASSSSHGHGSVRARCHQRLLGASAEAAVEEPMIEAGPARRQEANAALNEAAARVAGRFHQSQEAIAAAAVADNQAALDLMGEYALQDEIQEPHSGMQ